jgi:hypothetical protein
MEMYRAIAASLGRHLPDVSWRDVEALIDHFRDETTYVRRNIPARERTVGALGPFTVKGVSVTTAHSELALASS